jgi:hypothetical protein
MALTYPWMLGRHLTNGTIQGAIPGADGTLTPAGSVLNWTAIAESIEHETQPDHEDIRPVNSIQKNMVLTGQGNGGTLTTIQQSRTAQQLSLIANTYNYCFLTWTAGDETWGATNGWFAVGRFGGGIRGRGKNTQSLILLPCDPTVPQLSYSAA